MLTPQQISYFETFGFLKMPSVFSSQEVNLIRKASIKALGKLEDNSETNPHKSQFSMPFFELDSQLTNLLDDDRIHQIPESLLGSDFFLDQTEGHQRVGDTPWHGSTNFSDGIRFIKVAMYLDTLVRSTGCLRVIPGSHREGKPDLFRNLRIANKDPKSSPFGLSPSDIPCVALESNPGDVLVFTEKVIHGAFGGNGRRLQICASFFANPTTEDQINEIISEYKKTKYSFRPSESYINSENPRIRRMVSKLVELGFETSKLKALG